MVGEAMRIRTIKPDFFKHDKISDLKPLTRLLFISLWCLADRRGRLEDRPKRIKVECLPYDDCDVDALLWELHNAGFIDRYEVDGVKVIGISSFEKHQRISGKEAESESEFPGKQQGSNREAPSCELESQERKGKEEEKEGKRNVPRQAAFTPPSEQEWVEYCTRTWSDWHPVCAGEAWAYYQGVGWIVGRKTCKDWKSTARTAHGNARQWGKLQPQRQAWAPPVPPPITCKPGELDGISKEATDRL